MLLDVWPLCVAPLLTVNSSPPLIRLELYHKTPKSQLQLLQYFFKSTFMHNNCHLQDFCTGVERRFTVTLLPNVANLS